MHRMNIAQIDANLLVSLDVLLAERSVTRSAKRLGLSQSAMSHQLRRLRELFEDPLLVGGRGGMVPSPLAETLEAPLRRALLDLGRAVRGELAFDPATAQRTFTVATKDTVEMLGLPPLLGVMARQAPGIRMHAQPLSSRSFVGLQDGDVDVAIGGSARSVLGMNLPGLRERVLFEHPFVCVVRRGHAAAKAGRLEIDDYLALRHIQIETPGGPHSAAIDDALAERGLARTISAKVSSFVAGLFVVASTDLVATVVKGIAAPLAPRLGLTMLDAPLDLAGEPLTLTWHERFDQDPANKWLRARIVEICGVFGSLA